MKLTSILIGTLTLATIGLSLYYLNDNSKDLTYLPQYLKFKKDFNKLYSSPSESEYRYGVFIENMKKLEEYK